MTLRHSVDCVGVGGWVGVWGWAKGGKNGRKGFIHTINSHNHPNTTQKTAGSS
jgi:hypothetical protein